MFIVSDLPRTTTRQKYKKMARWARIARNIVEAEIDFSIIKQIFEDVMMYGTSVLRISESGQLKHCKPGEIIYL